MKNSHVYDSTNHNGDAVTVAVYHVCNREHAEETAQNKCTSDEAYKVGIIVPWAHDALYRYSDSATSHTSSIIPAMKSVAGRTPAMTLVET